MGAKGTLDWVKNEWALLSRRDEMSASETLRWVRQWVPFGGKTLGYGAVSLCLGPLTRDHRASLWAMKHWARSSLKGLGIDVDVDGVSGIPEGGVVYAANHQSLIDILVLAAVLPGDFKWVAKRKLMNVPVIGWHLKLAGHVPVDRKGNAQAAREAMERFVGVIEAGNPLLIFPEGTRSPDGVLKPFKKGGFRAAATTNAPVMPVMIDGTYAIMSKDAASADTGPIRTRHRVTVRVGAAISPDSFGGDEDPVGSLRDRTHAAVEALQIASRA